MSETPVALREHAVARYQERVKVGLTKERCARELAYLVGIAGEPVETLDWHSVTADPPDAYLILSDGIALCLRAGTRGGAPCWWAITCITRSGHSPEVRAARNARRAKRRAIRRWRNRRTLPDTRDRAA